MFFEMRASESNTKGVGFSLRRVLVALLFLTVFKLGMGWARGLVDGNYLVGILGLVLALGPVLWLLSQFRDTYF